MAHERSPKARLLHELSRSRQSSPYDDNVYMTATGTSFHDVLHSTPLRDSPQHALPIRTDQLPDPFEHDDNGSTEMSIEIGRGTKGQSNVDISSEGIFNFGNDDSQYEVTATPPIPPRNGLRKMDNSFLRKEASVRRATESARVNGSSKRSANGSKVRAVSDVLPKVSVESDNSYTARDFAPVAPASTRGTRFAGARQPSLTGLPTRFVAGQGLDVDLTPQRTANLNTTLHSTTFTANQSFMLPNIPDITEVVSGVRGTPRSRSRFTSGSHKAQPHRVVGGIEIPHEEKAIFASLQMLQGRNSELEAERLEAMKRADQFEGEVFDLRNKLRMESEKVSGEADFDESMLPPVKRSKAAGKLEASLKDVQKELDRAEHKRSMAQNSLQRVTKERDELITQIAAVYFSSEELLRENEEYRTRQTGLLTEIDKLKDEVEVLKTENEKLRMQIRNGGKDVNVPGTTNPGAGKVRKLRESQNDGRVGAREIKGSMEDFVQAKTGESIEADLASRIEREVQRYRDEARRAENARHASDYIAQSATLRPRSKSKPRATKSANRDHSIQRTVSAPPDLDVSDSDSTTELDMTRKSQDRKRTRSENNTVQVDIEQDITVLSDLDEDVVAKLRKKIEEEHRARRLQKQASNSAAAPGVRRKSSLKGPSENPNEDTGRISVHSGIAEDTTKTGKTVRVQSPHISEDTIPPPSTEVDTGDISVLSNTSRRRRRASSTEAMTSAFIIPDITIHPGPQTGKSCIAHDTASCTVCKPVDDDGNGDPAAIPDPIPASQRAVADDVTDATIRPAQPSALALATVIKLLEDEITHLKIQRDAQNRLYNRHDPAVSKRRRLLLKARLDSLTAEVEKRSNQVYALYDVLEGQRVAAEAAEAAEAGVGGKWPVDEEEVEETLMSVGIDPVEISGRLGRSAPPVVGMEGEEWSEDSEELPWEGLSDAGSE